MEDGQAVADSDTGDAGDIVVDVRRADGLSGSDLRDLSMVVRNSVDVLGRGCVSAAMPKLWLLRRRSKKSVRTTNEKQTNQCRARQREDWVRRL